VALWQALVEFLESILNIFYSFTRDYGVAIVLLTAAVRVVLIPLTIKQTRSMYEMQKIQPKIRELQKKYRRDKERLQKEIMKFYAEHKINPFSGCLPLLLQLPIFFALFRVLTTSFREMVKGKPPLLRAQLVSSLGILKDLTWSPAQALTSGFAISLPYILLVLLTAITTYVPQHMITKDKQQRQTTLFMTIFMVFIAWSLPAGVLIYWVTTNIWTIGQQYLTLRYYQVTGE
jgi:YidC/Oxa1 family membrane protein insertase